jgi:NAD(P)H-dependent flavin oxidoreductase YrpB (nitropropane dioxygenase family)
VLAKPIALRRFASIPPVRGATGDFDQMALLAGQGVGSVRKISSAHDVITDMATQARSILHGLR